MPTDWILRSGDGANFKRSSIFKIWGIKSTDGNGKYFLNNVRSGDRLWFVTSNSHGKIIAMASYVSHNIRQLGPLLQISRTNDELGWTDDGGLSDTEIHYTNLYNLSECGLLSYIKSPRTIRQYNEKCMVNLPVEYEHIVRYSKVTLKM